LDYVCSLFFFEFTAVDSSVSSDTINLLTLDYFNLKLVLSISHYMVLVPKIKGGA